MPNPVEGFFEVYEDMVEVLLVLEIFLTQNAQVVDLLCGTPSCSEACLFFGNDLLCLWLQSIQYDLQHDSPRASSEKVRPIRSEQCQNTKFSRSRHWKWPRLADDDLPPS